jgi:hypothetical protein
MIFFFKYSLYIDKQARQIPKGFGNNHERMRKIIKQNYKKNAIETYQRGRKKRRYIRI